MIRHPQISPIKIKLAKQYYLNGYSISDINKELDIPERTLFRWAKNDNWQSYATQDDMELVLSRRLNVLAERENKTSLEVAEFSMLCEKFGNLRVQLAEADRIKSQAIVLPPLENRKKSHPGEANFSDGGEKSSKRGDKKEKLIKNDISKVSIEQILLILQLVFFEYQRLWWANRKQRNRFLLKSRQIGATYYFAFEALADAIITGDNQLFLSASRDQAEVFKAYIIAFAREHLQIELKGSGGVITLSNGAELRFLSTNSRTAQSYHGHLYVDECFWIPDFNKMWKVASGMAAHSKWRRTLFSTPSAISHQAYSMWSGEKFNQGKAEANKVTFDLSPKALKAGELGADNIWRHLVTVKDAEEMGCNLFNIDELKTEYSADDFANLFMCEFIDDAKSVFNLGIMMTCYADKEYIDYREDRPRPYDRMPVAIGYDPSRTRDNASLALLAIPLRPKDKWRVLKTFNFHGQNFQYQANRIKELVDSHNVQHIGIDVTGIGYGLFELVQGFYSRAVPINYSHDIKTQLVMKAIDVIENGRLEYQPGNIDITQAFMMITKTTTSSGAITYASNRNGTNGHADIAWSIMHALHYEPIANDRKRTTVAIG